MISKSKENSRDGLKEEMHEDLKQEPENKDLKDLGVNPNYNKHLTDV